MKKNLFKKLINEKVKQINNNDLLELKGSISTAISTSSMGLICKINNKKTNEIIGGTVENTISNFFNEETINELNETITEPKINETKDQFVKRHLFKMEKIIDKKLNK